ncbi:hypothetical protein BC940DRAFT_304659 [Gongronella butleri]|nr:hypothetical protein BC940DRAFT_304659 [Gongronella butleri]
MKVVVTGASGLLGRAVVRQLKQAGHTVIGTAFSRAAEHLYKVDLMKTEEMHEFLDERAPQAIVHCAAERRPDVAELDPDAAEKLNSVIPGALARYSRKNNVFLVYISTDYVFDGKHPPYQVDAKPAPLNSYGWSKLRGEEAVRAADPDAAILRIPILYGEVEFNGESAVNMLIDVLKNTSKTSVMDHYCVRYPTNVNDVAHVIKDLVEAKVDQGRPIAGTYHFSAEEAMTKYEMCQVFSAILKVPMDHLQPQTEVDTSAAASRPKDCHLSTQRLKDEGIDVSFVPFQAWFQQYLTQ